ncbi:MAG: ABC transporter permease [Thermoflexales bacterium]|nr:ABC transporter permease [Thermoflexales bacterium]
MSTLAKAALSPRTTNQTKVRTQTELAWRRFRRHPSAMVALITLIVLILIVTIGPMIYTVNPIKPNPLNGYVQMFSPKAPLGTDDVGRDLLARLLFGGRISLAVGVFAMLVSIIIGTLIGSYAGYYGGLRDFALSRFTDLFQALPVVPVLLLVTYLFKEPIKVSLGRELGVFVLVVGMIGALNWMTTARLVRSSFMSLKARDFVEAAHALGVSEAAIMFRHILPNALGPIVISATLNVGGAIITESVLSFLGVGFEADWPTWGSLVFQYKDFIGILNHAVLLPALMIFITVLAVNYLGEGLRDALDPRKSR